MLAWLYEAEQLCLLRMQGSVAGTLDAPLHKHGVPTGEEAGPGPSLGQAEQMEPSLNGPVASLAGHSYSDAAADQDISSPKRQVSSAQHRPQACNNGELLMVAP